MSIQTLTANDTRLRDAVMRQLEWDPEVDAAAVGVAAKDGAVTLTGFVATYVGKLAAERAAKRVHGVRAVANDIAVSARLDRTDADIAHDASRALELRSTLPKNVQAVVHNGIVTLTGEVEWLYQKDAAARVVGHLRGVRGVLNHLSIKPRASAKDLRRRIVGALHRHADIDARRLTVEVSGGTAVLTGTVETWLQREAAEKAVASAPGVVHVDNRIAIESMHDSKLDQWDDEC
jgi:osmotically-inducible protein OsmY